MTTKTKEVRIGAIKLTDGGNKGLVVTYEQTEIRNNREFFTEFVAKKKFPIHEELNNQIQSLAKFLLEICNYTEVDALIGSTEIIGVKYNDNGFLISGKLTTISDKVFAINTPLITLEDGYPDYDKIIAILDTIYAETKEYMDGKKVLSDVQYVINLNKGNEAFDIETFNKLPEEEQFKIASDIMAKNKCFVTKLDDLILEEETPPLIDTTPFIETEVPLIDVVNEHLEKTPARELGTLSDDEIILPVEEKSTKKSTAKKIAS